ncbi:hypothetical protein AWB75_00345 [Caballeronia catudaia]|uniref:Uncharacterized protein n=1 Tax=Caballeronia catudaia TaxID=1777136 RepID=A0A157Z7H0_9BURK|nr:hypothetical protein [Caballeronia catudaia]SAK41465.1 hypothetical protein AWB75_00345 [Caballeronia catudaia]
MSQASMSTMVAELYEKFDATRRKLEARDADDADLRELEAIDKQLRNRNKDSV